MKLTKVQKKLFISIRDSILSKCYDKTDTSYDIWWKIDNEIRIPNEESISVIKRTIINK